MIIQIYEVQTSREAGDVIAAGVDQVGSVLTDGERWKNREIAETIREVGRCGAKSSLIPLFSDADRISFAMDYHRPDIVHFCEAVIDDSSAWEALCGRLISIQATIRERFPEIAIMRSIPVPQPGETLPVPLDLLASYFEPMTDFFLTDTWRGKKNEGGPDEQPVTGFIGITGQTCDWTMAAELAARSSIPVILAGGLGPDNVAEAIDAVHPAGVDSCTNTNAVDELGKPVRFRKDMNKVARFVAEARKCAGK